MATVKRFEDMNVWQLARELALDIYKETLINSFFIDFELKGQIRNSEYKGFKFNEDEGSYQP